MQQLLESFETLKKHFGADAKAVEIIDGQTLLANEWIVENSTEREDNQPRRLGTVEESDRPRGVRSIFDDVDS
jgi:hypothetical protein